MIVVSLNLKKGTIKVLHHAAERVVPVVISPEAHLKHNRQGSESYVDQEMLPVPAQANGKVALYRI